MIRPGRPPRGQVLIISAVAMIVLMAIGAIVVDLGMSWLLHRKEQNAADPGAIAAAHWVPPNGNQSQMEGEACFFAQQNGFFIGDLGCAAALANGDLDVNSPPATTRAGDFQGRQGFVEVVIRDTHPSFFGQLFGRPVAEVVTAAVAANTEGNSNSSSLVALGNACSGGPDRGDSAVSGGADVNIFPATGVTAPGGYVNVNADCGNQNDICANGSGQNALAISGELEAPYFFVTGGCSYSGSGTPQPECLDPLVDPCLDEGAIPTGDPLAGLIEPWPYLQGVLAVPACPDPSELNAPNDGDPCTLSSNACGGTCTLDAGVYYAGWKIQGSVAVVLKPGMYVLAGGGIDTSAQSSLQSVTDVDSGGNPIEARITIFSTDGPNCPSLPKQCQGPINMTGQGAILLKATNIVTCQQVSPQICPWKGILLWQDGTVNGTPGDIKIEGGSDLVLSGTIYAPESKVLIRGGNASTGCLDTGSGNMACLAIQIIARQWEIAGNAEIDMPYDPSELYQLEQQGLVH